MPTKDERKGLFKVISLDEEGRGWAPGVVFGLKAIGQNRNIFLSEILLSPRRLFEYWLRPNPKVMISWVNVSPTVKKTNLWMITNIVFKNVDQTLTSKITGANRTWERRRKVRWHLLKLHNLALEKNKHANMQPTCRKAIQMDKRIYKEIKSITERGIRVTNPMNHGTLGP